MTENVAALAANSPAAYDRRRFETGVEIDPLPGMDFRMRMTLRCLEWCLSSLPPAQRAVLDVAAGMGNVGQAAKTLGTMLAYHATEQSPRQCARIRERVADAAVCEWRCEEGAPSLHQALGAAVETFWEHYPVVLLSHGPEHHADDYAIMDECWSMVAPGGFLLVIAARNDPHRSHFRKYTLDDLAALCGYYAGFGNPLVTWPLDYWADIYIAIPKPMVGAS